MTQVNIITLSEHTVFEFSGHSHFAEKGKDIVCAAASALCEALISSVEQLEGEGLARVYRKLISNGYVWFEFGAAEDFYAAARLRGITDTVYNGLSLIEEEYPEYLKIG